MLSVDYFARQLGDHVQMRESRVREVKKLPQYGSKEEPAFESRLKDCKAVFLSLL